MASEEKKRQESLIGWKTRIVLAAMLAAAAMFFSPRIDGGHVAWLVLCALAVVVIAGIGLVNVRVREPFPLLKASLHVSYDAADWVKVRLFGRGRYAENFLREVVLPDVAVVVWWWLVIGIEAAAAWAWPAFWRLTASLEDSRAGTIGAGVVMVLVCLALVRSLIRFLVRSETDRMAARNGEVVRNLQANLDQANQTVSGKMRSMCEAAENLAAVAALLAESKATAPSKGVAEAKGMVVEAMGRLVDAGRVHEFLHVADGQLAARREEEKRARDWKAAMTKPAEGNPPALSVVPPEETPTDPPESA